MTDHASLPVVELDETYQKDPILRPLINVGMKERDLDQHKNLKRASVLALLFQLEDDVEDDDDKDDNNDRKNNNNNNKKKKNKNEWHILLTQRPMHLKSHPGQVCLPGGRQEDSDHGNDITTALRETQEEVGISQEEVIPFARMETIESVNKLCVTPIIALWASPRKYASQLVLCQKEVEAAFYVPLSYFWKEENCSEKEDIEWRGNFFTMRTYYWNDIIASANNTTKTNPTMTTKPSKSRIFKIWGLTAHILYEMAQICKPSNYDETIVAAIHDGNDNQISSPSSVIRAGKLYRWIDDTSGKPYFAQRYFVLLNSYYKDNSTTTNHKSSTTTRILHQYDSERKANAKAGTATKKNRLLLDKECQIKTIDKEEENSKKNQNKYCFSISVLNGRIIWKLAGTSSEERDAWITALQYSPASTDMTIINSSDSANATSNGNKKLKT